MDRFLPQTASVLIDLLTSVSTSLAHTLSGLQMQHVSLECELAQHGGGLGSIVALSVPRL
jgi:hypothetical protein